MSDEAADAVPAPEQQEEAEGQTTEQQTSEQANEGGETQPANEEAGETEQGNDAPTEDVPATEGQTEATQATDTAGDDTARDEQTAPEPETQPEPLQEITPQELPPTTGNAGSSTVAREGHKEADVDPHARSPEPRYDRDATATELETTKLIYGGDSSVRGDGGGRGCKVRADSTYTIPEHKACKNCWHSKVKFVLMPSGQVATMRCGLSQTLSELKHHFATELKIPPTMILFMFDGNNMEDRITLADLGVGPNGTVQLEMQSADPVNTPLKGFRPKQEYHMPDVITVRVTAENSGFKDVVVEIERPMKKKPFLGGFRHKETGAEFHHAAAQTMQKQRNPPTVPRFCRDTQTVEQKHIVQQTTNDTSTQMTKIGVYVSNMPDKLLSPGKYTTADSFHSNIFNQVVVIQKYYRRWLARRYVEKVRNDQEERTEWERLEELRKKKEKEDRIKREFERRMNPKTKEDFDLLFHALEKWRQEEEERINTSLSGAERKAALCQLLEQQTQLIASIGRHKLDADDENRNKRILKFLDKAAAPKKWKGPDGKYTEMDTPYTIRAQELRDIYNSINMKYLTMDERLDVLLTLKHTVKEHDCKLTQDIIELIDREADLLMRGVKETNLDGLRKRISTLFLQYIRTPTFNPEAARLLKVPQDPSSLRKNIYFCPSCNQYLPSTEFHLSSNSSSVGRCRKCNKVDNDGRVRQDYSHYRFMLKSLRKNEEAYGDDAKIAFLMQENDLRYLVENVWNSQSLLSAWEDLYDLVLVRWDRHEEWSPWNCILLTKEEAAAHDKLESLEEAYGKTFVHKVKHKHTLARNYFSRLPGMAEHLRSRENSSKQLATGPAISGKAVPKATIKA